MTRTSVGFLALIAVLIALFHLHQAGEGVVVTQSSVGETPVTIFRRQSDISGSDVVIAHEFTGSQQLMQPFAETLAQNGYIAVTFDFFGHGRNPLPMRGDITEGKAITGALLGELKEVAAAARNVAGSDGRLAVLGHSMASDIVVRCAQADPDVRAVFASLASP